MSATSDQKASLARKAGLLLRVDVEHDVDWHRLVLEGLPTSAYRALAEHVAIKPSDIGPDSTIRRRLATEQARFTRDESERLVRIARIFVLAVERIGDPRRAKRWLLEPAGSLPGLGVVTPLGMCRTETGSRMVEEHLRQATFL